MSAGKRGTSLAISLLIGAFGVAQDAVAQSSIANITATVNAPITVTTANDMDFGTVFPGVDRTLAVTDADAAAFSVTGQASQNVNLTFVLPSSLSDGGLNTLTINSWTGRHNTTNSSASGTDFTPSGTPAAATLSGAGELYVFVGATVQPGALQAGGAYSGQMTLTIVYF